MIKSIGIPKHMQRDINEILINQADSLLSKERYYDVQMHLEAILITLDRTLDEVEEKTIETINNKLIANNRPILDFSVSKLKQD